ncbi:MAG TPA: P1 family peptidase [Spirochaetales bacterium]|nr:P1 family peptidase [Spirochaetales bacterium]HPM71834.1 P1 family peptidase [Spirochaetales bacterium]
MTRDAGPTDSIVDVAGVSVGHATIADGGLQTGVTAVLPHAGNLFRDKAPAACRVFNGFGKSVGLLQVEELGVVESPILLSNTFAMSACVDGALDLLLAENPDIARETGSANVVALECNDGYLSDMRRRAVTREHVAEAIRLARSGSFAREASLRIGAGGPSAGAFARGSVGAGRGMSCYGLKGGIGTASRVALADGRPYTVGTLTLTNFGRLSDFVVHGRLLGKEIEALGGPAAARIRAAAIDGSGVGSPGDGSVIVVLTTDAPLDSRQLRRLCMRAASGLARTGAVIGGGSGELALAFSTAYTVPHDPPPGGGPLPRATLHEDLLDPLFRAATDCVEAAVLDSLYSAETVVGRDGHERVALSELGLG